MPKKWNFVDLGISIDPKVCGGEACIEKTRIPVWMIVKCYKLGKSNDDIIKMYPNLKPDNLTNAMLYYALDKSEIDQLIAKND